MARLQVLSDEAKKHLIALFCATNGLDNKSVDKCEPIFLSQTSRQISLGHVIYAEVVAEMSVVFERYSLPLFDDASLFKIFKFLISAPTSKMRKFQIFRRKRLRYAHAI